MKTFSIKVLALTALASLSTPSLAENIYIGGSLGQSKADDACSGISVTSCDDKDTAYKLYMGYKFNDNFALEGFYTDLGKITAYDSNSGIGAEAEEDTFGLAAVGILPLTEQFNVFAKLGFHRWDAEGKGTLNGAVVTILNDSGTDAMYGIGASFSITESLSIRAEWEAYKAGDDYDVLSAGVIYAF